ncbi:MAG: hypothetical protein K9I69_06800, partial [Ignavibacteriales bacterium]|nr:hypothetical protein [Ignavibacteriales bacterium]
MSELEVQKQGIIPSSITKEQARDTGMALVLISLLAGLFWDKTFFVVAIFLQVINMTVPVIFRPAGYVWYGFPNLFGHFVSKIVLALIYVLLIIPVAAVRKMMGKDSMQLKVWRKGNGSVFRDRSHQF